MTQLTAPFVNGQENPAEGMLCGGEGLLFNTETCSKQSHI